MHASVPSPNTSKSLAGRRYILYNQTNVRFGVLPMPVDYQQIRSSVRSMGQALAGNVRELAERRKRAFDILQKNQAIFPPCAKKSNKPCHPNPASAVQFQIRNRSISRQAVSNQHRAQSSQRMVHRSTPATMMRLSSP